MKKFFIAVLVGLSISSASLAGSFQSKTVQVNPLIEGTYYIPEKPAKNLVILIAGSGPTNRDGNQPGVKNNSLKLLAEALAGSEDIAVFSYDKRILAQMKSNTLDESKLRFEDFAEDAAAVVKHFRKENQHSSIFLAGHSEGALIATIAASQAPVEGVISIAGPGRSIDAVLIDQISKQAPQLADETKEILASLKKGDTVTLKNPALFALFRPSAQPYLISWIKYQPTELLSKLNVPVMIIQGGKDLQVEKQEGDLLAKAAPKALYLFLPEMNHVLKPISEGLEENQKSYNSPELPLDKDLAPGIIGFVSNPSGYKK